MADNNKMSDFIDNSTAPSARNEMRVLFNVAYRAKHPDVEKTWETRINPTLFQQMQLGTLKITVPEEEQFRQPKPQLKKAACMGY